MYIYIWDTSPAIINGFIMIFYLPPIHMRYTTQKPSWMQGMKPHNSINLWGVSSWGDGTMYINKYIYIYVCITTYIEAI